jgi:hypothetical protein
MTIMRARTAGNPNPQAAKYDQPDRGSHQTERPAIRLAPKFKA